MFCCQKCAVLSVLTVRGAQKAYKCISVQSVQYSSTVMSVLYDTVRTVQYGTVRYDTVRTVRYGTLRYATVHYGTKLV